MRWLSLGRVWQQERKALIYDPRRCIYDEAFRELAQNTAAATTMPIALDLPTITLPSAGEILSAVGTGLKAAGEAALDFAGEAATGALGVVGGWATSTRKVQRGAAFEP